ncbi:MULTISPECIES: DUF4192 domain-containing protein [Actinomycetes]|jgi:hypothetical protein|uniref:DUF4192 domain-containing protein n=2 Tax=Actinomycetes TaxID=1760 RepID=A0A7W4VXA6_9ACTN|nr:MULTISPECIES: DUF4192 domain-containing protein [Actinomycetes]MBB3043435.1 hypothetical protein [Nocardioides soli]UPU46912.1 DUF4192 domain-containing protein [Rhodococcus qingshengii JCM 15477]
MTNTLKISSHDELISSIPHTLGFTPRGMVCLAFGDGPTARLDIPESPEEMGEFLQALTDVYLHRHHPRRVALVAYGEDGRACVQALAALGEALINSEVRGPDVGPMLWVNGEEWTDLLEGTRGTVDPSTRARIDAEFALMGRVMPVGRREDLAAAMQGDPTAVADHLPAAEARALDMDVATTRSEVEWLGARLDHFRRDREYLSDDDAARVLAVLHDSGARDAAVFSMSRKDAPVFSEFWQDLVRRAPSEVRDSPATMLALSSFLEGKGAQAWTALDQLSESDPLADLVAAALDQAVDPREWDRAVPAAAGALMQQAALSDTFAQERRAHDRDARNAPGVNGAGPESSAPGR